MTGVSDAELDAFARQHVGYEIRTVVTLAAMFADRNPNGVPLEGGFGNPIDDALLEAVLVHLRLLGDFLGSRRMSARDLHASDWVPDWRGRAWLANDVRARINAQVAHLSKERDPSFDWRIRDYAYACCGALDEFVRAVRANCPDRSPAFSEVEATIAQGLRIFAP
jgi:hypothetical protein